MKVILDPNEFAHDNAVQDRLHKALGNEVEIDTLECCDLEIVLSDGRVLLFEVKHSINDLVASIADDRLFEQAREMRAKRPFAAILVIEEPIHYGHDGYVHLMGRHGFGKTYWNRARIEAALNRVAKLGVIVLREVKDFAREAKSVADECMNGHIYTRRAVTFDPLAPKERQAYDWLSGALPGVGGRRALSLVRAIGTGHPLIDYFCAALNPMEQYPAMWGAKTQSNLRDMFGLKRGEVIGVIEKA